MNKYAQGAVFVAFFSLYGCGGSGSDDSEKVAPTAPQIPFSLNFKAISGELALDCGSLLSGFGSDATDSIALNDLRFYVSNVALLDVDGNTLEATLDTNAFQYTDANGSVALIDLTANDSGYCASDVLAGSEGTLRTNSVVTGTLVEGEIASIRFDVGVPQALMKSIIAVNTAEDAPSPLGEMQWSWLSGYRHFVMNFSVMNEMGTKGEGYIHLGSRGCGNGIKALEDKDTCDFVNTPTVSFEGFDPAIHTVTVDAQALLKGLMMVEHDSMHHGAAAPADEHEEGYVEEHDAASEMMDMPKKPGVSCHAAPADKQPDCGPIFTNFGLDAATGVADSTTNTVFGFE